MSSPGNRTDAAHLGYAGIVEGAQSIGEVFSQEPGFATIEKNASNQSIVDHTFYAQVNGEAGEDIFERTEC